MTGTRFGRFARGVASHPEIIWFHVRDRSGISWRFSRMRLAILLYAGRRVGEVSFSARDLIK